MSINGFVDDHPPPPPPVVNMFFHLSQNTRFPRGICIFFVFAYYAELQDVHKKWRENDFWEKWPLDSSEILQVKNFVKIDLCCTISEINMFLHFTQKFKMTAKSGGKTIFGKSRQ